MERKTVTLVKPVEAHGKMTRTIVLKEPNGGLYVKHGDPFVTVWLPSGGAYQVERPEIIQAYLEALIVDDDQILGAMILNMIGVEDTMAVKETLFSFFTEAAAKRAATRLTASSSASAFSPSTSLSP